MRACAWLAWESKEWAPGLPCVVNGADDGSFLLTRLFHGERATAFPSIKAGEGDVDSFPFAPVSKRSCLQAPATVSFVATKLPPTLTSLCF